VEQNAKFYAACITTALEYLHERSIVHRDIKPENLMISSETGHLVLGDFGMAKFVEEKTWSFCGTPEYIAPEIILQSGHDVSVDYWAFGCVLYEMLTGNTPFRDSTPKAIYDRVMCGIDLAPSVFFCNKTQMKIEISEKAMDLVKGLCKRSPTSRLGYQKNGFEDIRRHRWFKDFDWEKRLDQRSSGPYSQNIEVRCDLNSKRLDELDMNQKTTDGKPVPPENSGWDTEFSA